MKGVILAGGKGTRLYPLTYAVCKQLLPIYDKPMIYYPLSVLMFAGIREILIIATKEDLPRFQQLLRDGSQWGLSLSYAVQETPNGIAQAFIIGESFIGQDPVALILGDNIFYGQGLAEILASSSRLDTGAIIFGYEVKDPQRYGVVALNREGQVVELIEKPKDPPSRIAITGLYFYDNDVIAIAKSLTPSERMEYEITDVNRAYLQRGDLKLHLLERGFAWLDTGTHESLQLASQYVKTIQDRQGTSIACLEEIAYRQGYITRLQLAQEARRLENSDYGQYLQALLDSDSLSLHPEKLLCKESI